MSKSFHIYFRKTWAFNLKVLFYLGIVNKCDIFDTPSEQTSGNVAAKCAWAQEEALCVGNLDKKQIDASFLSWKTRSKTSDSYSKTLIEVWLLYHNLNFKYAMLQICDVLDSIRIDDDDSPDWDPFREPASTSSASGWGRRMTQPGSLGPLRLSCLQNVGQTVPIRSSRTRHISADL